VLGETRSWEECYTKGWCNIQGRVPVIQYGHVLSQERDTHSEA
jgi:hypothetical protein